MRWESIEHTKLKPLTLPLLVDQNQRILGISAGTIPTKGHLAEISRRKYGNRVSESSQLITNLLVDLPKNIAPIVVKTDGKQATALCSKLDFLVFDGKLI